MSAIVSFVRFDETKIEVTQDSDFSVYICIVFSIYVYSGHAPHRSSLMSRKFRRFTGNNDYGSNRAIFAIHLAVWFNSLYCGDRADDVT